MSEKKKDLLSIMNDKNIMKDFAEWCKKDEHEKKTDPSYRELIKLCDEFNNYSLHIICGVIKISDDNFKLSFSSNTTDKTLIKINGEYRLIKRMINKLPLNTTETDANTVILTFKRELENEINRN